MGLLEKIQEISPDIVIIMYGTVDLQVRHNMETNKFGILSLTPGRYENIKGMLNPRHFMSKRRENDDTGNNAIFGSGYIRS